jgi:hypothetical protein
MFLCLAAVLATSNPYFHITVTDADTGRGVPLVELTTVNGLRFVTDSNGIVAFQEPGLMGRKVFFTVRSHGYEFPKDGFGSRGTALETTPGGHAELRIKRVNLAERLYRVTGQGIYADSLLVGAPVPVKQPALNAAVLGSDSVLTAVYRGRLYWFWGDTNFPEHPLGNFNAPGATSELPGNGGLDPAVGVDLDYFLDERGRAKAAAPMPGPGPTWLTGLVVLKSGGRERMFAAYMKIRGQFDVYDRGLAEFNDDAKQFEPVARFPADAPLRPDGHPFLHTDGGVEYVYFAAPFPLARVRAEPDALRDLGRYEGYTCLEAGTKPADGRLDRGPDGRLRFGWKRGTPPLDRREQDRLIKAGRMKPEEALIQLRDADTGKVVVAHAGSVYWNRYRGRWVLIAVETGGSSSFLGEVWYAEADTPTGPWAYARKVVTHDRYSFYNPKQHPAFDQDGGRLVYFEGTYTNTFSGNPDRTPRYDYNQIMYRLDLARPELCLPVPVYRTAEGRFGTATDVPEQQRRPSGFFALDRAGPGTVPMTAGAGLPLFHGLPADREGAPATTLPLYEYRHADGRRTWSVDPGWRAAGFERTERPVARVWRDPREG